MTNNQHYLISGVISILLGAAFLIIPTHSQAQESGQYNDRGEAKQEDRQTNRDETKSLRTRQGRTIQNQTGERPRIPDDVYHSRFGRGHTFRVTEGDYRNHGFAFNGYRFGFVDPWPTGWLYTQQVYVIELDGTYYLCNPRYPDIQLALSFEL